MNIYFFFSILYDGHVQRDECSLKFIMLGENFDLATSTQQIDTFIISLQKTFQTIEENNFDDSKDTNIVGGLDYSRDVIDNLSKHIAKTIYLITKNVTDTNVRDVYIKHVQEISDYIESREIIISEEDDWAITLKNIKTCAGTESDYQDESLYEYGMRVVSDSEKVNQLKSNKVEGNHSLILFYFLFCKFGF